MKWLRGLLLVVGVLLAGLVATRTWMLFAPPPVSPLPLSAGLTSVESAEGKGILAESGSVDHAPLDAAFQAQERRTWCGVASAATVLSALGEPIDQGAVQAPWQVTIVGMTLDELGGILQTHTIHGDPVHAEAVHAGDSTLDDFRARVATNLKTPGDYVLVNYDRGTLDQVGSGHISPISAYDTASDRLLVMDVAAHKYPPVWVSAETLWAAMDTIDGSSGLSRGWVEVRAAGP
jgi:hypothetical protein